MKQLMATVMLLVMFFSLYGCGQAAEEPENPYREVRYTNEYLTDGVVTSTDHVEFTYNDQNQLTLSIAYKDGQETSRTSFEYDENGNISRRTTISEEGISVSDDTYILDEENRILRHESYSDEVLTYIEEFAYDRRGNEIQYNSTFYADKEEDNDIRSYSKTYDRKGNLVKQVLRWNFNDEYIVWEYFNGQEIKQTAYNTNTDEIVEYWEFSYDDNGTLIRESRYSADGTLEYYNQYTHDETGLVVTLTSHDADGTPRNHKDTFTYDEHGNILMQERCRDGQVYWRISSTYELVEPTE